MCTLFLHPVPMPDLNCSPADHLTPRPLAREDRPRNIN